MTVLLSGACQRRPFAENRSRVVIVLNINTDIINHTQEELPENMRVDLYNPETSELVFTDYVGPTGGVIHPAPGVYDMIIYSIGTESTQVQNESNYKTIEAFTSEVSGYLRSQMAEFLTKDSDSYAGDLAVNQPDHIFVGWYDGLDIPVTYEDEPVIVVTVDVEAHTLVETWQVEICNVEGTENVSEVTALVSGQEGSVHIGPNTSTDRIVSVFFDMKVETGDNGRKVIKGKYNSFGQHPDRKHETIIDISVKNRGGGQQIFHFDVTDQMKDNPKQYILIQDPIKIEETGGGGGFQPVVDEWDDIHTDIIL